MKRNYPLVRSAPRGADELASIPLSMQLKILAELRSLADGGLLTAKKFSELNNEARCAYLAEALQDYDKATAYTVRGIAMPVRTADDAKNQEAWDSFASRVEEAVIDLTREDCKQISTNYLEGGMLVIGHRPPREQLDPFALGPRVIAVPISRFQTPGGPSEVGDTLSKLMSEIAVLSTRGCNASAKEVQELIEKTFQNKPAPYLQEAILKIEGVASDMEKNPEVPRTVAAHMLPYLRMIASMLKSRISLQLC